MPSADATSDASSDDANRPEWIRGCVGRAFIDSMGHWWCVSERAGWGDDPGDTPCLVFMSERAARCVRQFPPDWQERSDADLEALSWER
jgi:hypothetical protein